MKNFHSTYRQWLLDNHPVIEEEEWTDMMSADEAHSYDKYPLSSPNPEHEGATVDTMQEIEVPDDNVIVEANPNMYSFDS